MPLPALLLLIATLLPLASFGVLLFWGKRLGNPLAGYIGTAAIAGSFVLSLLAMFAWFGGGTDAAHGMKWGAGKGPISINYAWIPTGNGMGPDYKDAEHTGQTSPGFMDMGLYVDSLTVTMFMMITLVSTAVHVFSIGYMHADARFPRFFTYLGLFCFSMLGLVIGGTLLQLFVFWELVGLCSYLLIGFWWEKKSASNAAIKAFMANRVGDFGFLIGFGVLFYHVGNATLPALWTMLGSAGQGGSIMLPDHVTVFGASALTIMGVGLFCGAIGKSAQFPLHVWLPDAMEGPTPVSALIHAATMVAAGVYLVGRIFPILTPDAKMVIATIGLITLAMAALIAIAQTDIKKVLAYSTVSQLGYMILAMGVGSWIGGLFHLLTHAFFKALLFLGSGSVIHAAHHEQEMPQYGGLWRKIPVTAFTFLIGVAAIAGVPGLSGYFSKDTILVHAAYFAGTQSQQTGHGFYWIYFWIPAFVAGITAFYMMRCWMLTFWGKPRNEHLHKHAHETPMLWWPLVVLAFLSIFGAYVFVPSMLRNTIRETTAFCQKLSPQNKFEGFDTAHQFPLPWPSDEARNVGEEGSESSPRESEEAEPPALLQAHHYVQFGVLPVSLLGLAMGMAVYWNGYRVTDALMKFGLVRAIRQFLYRKMYFDELYGVLFIGSVRGFARMCGLFDTHVVDGLVNFTGLATKLAAYVAGANDKYVVDGAVAGSGAIARGIGALGRGAQSGRIRGYVTIMFVVLVAGMVAAVAVYLR